MRRVATMTALGSGDGTYGFLKGQKASDMLKNCWNLRPDLRILDMLNLQQLTEKGLEIYALLNGLKLLAIYEDLEQGQGLRWAMIR